MTARASNPQAALVMAVVASMGVAVATVRALAALVAVVTFATFVTVGAVFSPPVAAATLELSPTGQPTQHVFTFEEPEILGFGGVTFGMTPEDVESLVAELYPDGVREWQEDPVNLTRLLYVTLDALSPVPDLPGMGPAGITYVFGAQSKRLTAINVNWHVGSGGDATPEEREQLLALATAYVAELLRFDWPLGLTVRGVVAGPNAVILFAGEDLEGRGVEVVIDGVPLDVIILPDEIQEHRPIETGPVRLKIGLAERPGDPDVFKLEPGSF